MRLLFKGAMLAASLSFLPARPASAYDMDCAIMLCMAGGFPPGAVCTAAYAEMIRRITPWPSQPPFGICSFATMSVKPGGSGEVRDLDTSLPEYAWLRRSRVLWFYGRSYELREEPRRWDWAVRSCDYESGNCHDLARVHGSHAPWPASFQSENDQTLDYPGGGISFFRRAVMVEYGDYKGTMGHSQWIHY